MEAHDEFTALVAIRHTDTFRVLQQQHGGDEIEDRFAHGRVAPLGGAQGCKDMMTVLIPDHVLGGAYVGAIDGEAGDDLGQSFLEAKEGEISRPAMLFRDTIQAPRQHVQLT